MKRTVRPTTKRYPGKHVPEIQITRNVAHVVSGDDVLGLHNLVMDVGIVVCGCKRCRDGKTPEYQNYGTTHDTLIEPAGVVKKNLDVGHLGGGLAAFKREIRRLYPTALQGKTPVGRELSALKNRDKPKRKSAPAKKSAEKKSGTKAKKSTKTASKKSTKQKARKPASTKKK